MAGTVASVSRDGSQPVMSTHGRVIQCTPPDDPQFLRAVDRAYDQASRDLSEEVPLLVWTLVLIRRRYPVAVITLLARGVADEPDSSVWLVARDGWRAAAGSSQRRHSQHSQAG